MNNLIKSIENWSIDRNLNNADPVKQMLKLMEEIGELAQGLAKDNTEQVLDSIGDAVVVLTILSQQLGTSITGCTNLAYKEIADRKGKTINGVFVKEQDLG